MGATVRVWISWEGTEIDITNSTLDEQGRLSDSTTTSYDVAGMLEDAAKRAMRAVRANEEEA